MVILMDGGGVCPSGGQQVWWQGFGGGVLMAEGVACCWGMLCMQLGDTGTTRLPQASTCLKAGKGSGVFRAASHSPGGCRRTRCEGQGSAASVQHCSSPSPGKAARGSGVPGSHHPGYFLTHPHD